MPFSFVALKKTYVVTALGGIAFLFSPSVAHAGFQWTPPPAQQQRAVQPITPDAVVNGPLTPEPVEVIDVAPPVVKEPIPVEEKKQESAKKTTDAVERKDEAVKMTPSEVKQESAPVKAPIILAPEKQESAQPAMVEGFGKEVPLALALRDIVPPSYAFVFSSGDIAGMKASWRGGKAWTEVLKATLDTMNLQSAVNGNVVTISKKTGQTAVPAGYSARMSSPDVIVREQQQIPAPVERKKEEPVAQDVKPVSKDAPKSEEVIEFPSAPKVLVAEPRIEKPAEARIPVVDLKKVSKWEARPGTTLHQVLTNWCKLAGVDLNWSTAYDYPIENSFYFEGTYGQAIDSLLMSFGGQAPAPKGRLYPNLPDGPSVLMIN